MRSYTPGDADDEKELVERRAEPWMVELLKLNPHYVHWGPREDYMYKPGDEDPWHVRRKALGMLPAYSGWEARILFKTWKEHTVGLDDLNEVVNFYFDVSRDSKDCETCMATGYHPDALWISESFYGHMMEKLDVKNAQEKIDDMICRYPRFLDHLRSIITEGDGWHTKITQDEVDALVHESRLHDFTHDWTKDKGWQPKNPLYAPTATEVNEWASGKLPRKGLCGHDAINRMILVEARLKRLGIPKTCPACEGSCSLYVAEKAHIGLTYWLLHPRKGASRGVEVERFEQEDVPQIFAFLKNAAERNAQRFEKVVYAARRCT